MGGYFAGCRAHKYLSFDSNPILSDSEVQQHMLFSFSSTAMTSFIFSMNDSSSRLVGWSSFPLTSFSSNQPCSMPYPAARSVSLKHIYPPDQGPQQLLSDLAEEGAVRFQRLHRTSPVGKIFCFH